MGNIFKIIGSVFLFATIGVSLYAQEFNARVTVNYDQVQRSDRQIFQTLENSLFEFINNNKWTGDQYAFEERIECNFGVIITQMSGSNTFQASIQVQYARPVFNSSYNSTVLNFQDSDFNFEYLEFDRLEFNPNTSNTNLVGVLAFYCYVILGLDADTYERGGGSVYYQKALDVANMMQSGQRVAGWRDGEGNMGLRNRYWIAENLNNSLNQPFFEALYEYHRLGLDLMHEKGKHKEAKENIIAALLKLEEVHKKRPTSVLIQMFFDAKKNEIVKIFDDGEPVNIVQLKNILSNIDPNNSDKYQAMGGG